MYLNGSLEGLLNIQPLAHYCLVQLPFKSQEIHVGLRLWDQFPDLCVRKMCIMCRRTVARTCTMNGVKCVAVDM